MQSIVLEPDEVQERIRAPLDFMIAHVTFQRDQIVLLLLRQTGARLSEIVQMTVGGYRKAQHAGQAFVRNSCASYRLGNAPLLGYADATPEGNA